VPIDLVGVPYFVHRDDFAQIAPRWRHWTLAVKQLAEDSKAVADQFAALQIGWGAEMLAYNFAAAEVGVVHKKVSVQLRDVAPAPRSRKEEARVATVHMGRAFWPVSYAPAAAWEQTEGRSFRRRGTQVWCKCNASSLRTLPHPLPPADVPVDFASRHSLQMLSEAWRPAPTSRFRKRGKPADAVGDEFFNYP
jgi:hypothetical protein